MGYTVYVSKASTDKKDVTNFNIDAVKLLKMFGVKKTSADFKDTYATYTDRQACSVCCEYAINDDGSIIVNGPHEAFSANDGFCKTARKSYDCLIKLLAMLAEKHLGAEIGFDGDERFLDTIDSWNEKDVNTTREAIKVFKLAPLTPAEVAAFKANYRDEAEFTIPDDSTIPAQFVTPDNTSDVDSEIKELEARLEKLKGVKEKLSRPQPLPEFANDARFEHLINVFSAVFDDGVSDDTEFNAYQEAAHILYGEDAKGGLVFFNYLNNKERV